LPSVTDAKVRSGFQANSPLVHSHPAPADATIRAIRGQPDTLIHEIGHHFGYSDDDMEQIEFGEE
jgi:hypothetical protein